MTVILTFWPKEMPREMKRYVFSWVMVKEGLESLVVHQCPSMFIS